MWLWNTNRPGIPCNTDLSGAELKREMGRIAIPKYVQKTPTPFLKIIIKS